MNENSTDSTCYEITVTGRVQGVWFRKSTQDEANRLGLSGFVRNMPDGSVRIKAFGPGEACRRFIEWCHQGPPLARVREVTANEIEEEFSGDFTVLR